MSKTIQQEIFSIVWLMEYLGVEFTVYELMKICLLLDKLTNNE